MRTRWFCWDLSGFASGGQQAFLSAAQEAELKAWPSRTWPRSTCEVGTWIERQFGVSHLSRSGVVARLGAIEARFPGRKIQI